MPRPWMLEEMAEQPELVERLLREKPAEIAAALAGTPPPRRILFAGCGDMRFAAQAAAAYARLELGVPARGLAAMDLHWEAQSLGPEDVVVVASISGRTPRTLEAARLAARARARVIAVTDDPTAPLAREGAATIWLGTTPLADLELPVYAGYGHTVPQTKTFLAALLVELLIAVHVAARKEAPQENTAARLREITAARLCEITAARLRATLDRCNEELALIVQSHFADVREFVLLASGPYAPLASYGAAKLLEYALPARAQCLEEFHHLEMFVADTATALVLLVPDATSCTRALEFTAAYDELGVRILALGPEARWRGSLTRSFPLTAPDLASALFTFALPLQRLAFDAARMCGRDVDRWVGGHRGDLIQRMSTSVVRGSKPMV